MQRIVEPELMEEEEQARAYAEADFEEPHNHFVELFREIFGKNLEGTVLDLGCGPGDVTFRFAQAYPQCILHGIDGSEIMLKYGRKALAEQKELHSRIFLFQGRLPHASLPRKHYDAVISNSLLHHLHDPLVLWQTIQNYLKPGSPLFIMDLKRASTREEAQQLMETYASNEPEVLKNDFYHSLLAAFEVEEVKEQLNTAGLDYLSVKEVSDRHLIISGILH